MKLSKKILSSFMSVFILFTALTLNFALPTTAKAATLPVQLYYANATNGYIAIQNLAYTKNVTVHYSVNGGSTWQDTSASYLKTNNDGFEVWKFATPKVVEPYNSVIFAIKYQVNGQTYWDNNNASNYTLSKPTNVNSYTNNYDVFGKNKFAVDSTGGCSYGIEALSTINGTQYPSNVIFRYSTDNFVTYSDINNLFESYSITNSNNTTNFENIVGSNQFPFTCKYEIGVVINGVTYWDNNFGSYYVSYQEYTN